MPTKKTPTAAYDPRIVRLLVRSALLVRENKWLRKSNARNKGRGLA
jgi:hypothetical protein